MVIAVRLDRHEALSGLRVDGDKVVVNVMAGVANDDLRQSLTTDAALVRAIPLPSTRERRSVTVTFRPTRRWTRSSSGWAGRCRSRTRRPSMSFPH